MRTLTARPIIVCLGILLCIAQSMACHAVTGRHAQVVYVQLDQHTFFNNDNFAYFDQNLDISMQLYKRKDVSTLSGVLFIITTNDKVARTFMLDWVQGQPSAYIMLLGNNVLSKFEVDSHGLFAPDSATSLRIVLNFKRDSLHLYLGHQALHIHNLGLSVNKGYKFTLLPALSDSPSWTPDLQVQNLHVVMTRHTTSHPTWYWYVGILIADILIFMWAHLWYRARKIRLKQLQEPTTQPLPEPDDTLPPLATDKPLPTRSAILLFGEMQIYDSQGCDITKRFSPLLKELLCLILIHSAKDGISSDKMSGQLWFDKDRNSARNNRAVNIGKLKQLLDQVGDYELHNHDGYWKWESDTIVVDYLRFATLGLPLYSPSPQVVQDLLMLTRRGPLLLQSQYEWLDRFKAQATDSAIETLCAYAATLDIAKAPERALALANHIARLEPLNEQVLQLRCKAYSLSGRHSSAKKTYDKFREEYRQVYGEEFSTSLPELMERGMAIHS